MFQSKWGWHPCDWATFRLLKKLNAACEAARRRFAAWQRWRRKMPHNRVIRRWLRDAEGRRIGCEIVGPLPEPVLPALFCLRRQVQSFWGEDGRPLAEGRLVEEVVFDDRGIPDAYRTARKPAASANEVQPLRLTADIRSLVSELPD
jgi:hypothetical protein